MLFEHATYSFPSATGICDIFMQSFIPSDKDTVKGVIYIVHGMAEHSDRYKEAAEYFANNGFAVFTHDHAGHGRSIKTKDDLGYFGKSDGSEKITDDVNTALNKVKEILPDCPIVLWGHSMGSFVVRRFIAKYPGNAKAAVICGTSGTNPGVAAGIAAAKVTAKLLGKHHRSAVLNSMAFGTYNKKFDGDTGFEWLSKSKENIEKYIADDMCGFTFTAYGFKDLFTLLGSVSSKEWYNEVPSAMPLYLIAGADDPVGNYGKGVTEVYNKLEKSGHSFVEIKLYPELRHEIHNEDCKTEVFDDILTFANKVIQQ